MYDRGRISGLFYSKFNFSNNLAHNYAEQESEYARQIVVLSLPDFLKRPLQYLIYSIYGNRVKDTKLKELVPNSLNCHS